jgi:hypothetical protein
MDVILIPVFRLKGGCRGIFRLSGTGMEMGRRILAFIEMGLGIWIKMKMDSGRMPLTLAFPPLAVGHR